LGGKAAQYHNASLIILFVEGYRQGKYNGANPCRTGLLWIAIALGMVLTAIQLGG
jgi:hypothetical protein